MTKSEAAIAAARSEQSVSSEDAPTAASPVAEKPASSPSSRPVMPVLLLLGLLPAVMAGFVLAKARAYGVGVSEVTVALSRLRPACELDRRCAWYEQRPIVRGGSGRVSTRLWDKPRELLATEWVREPLSRVIWREPTVVVFDDAVSDEEVATLLNEASPEFEKTKVVNDDGEEVDDEGRQGETAFLPCHRGDSEVGSIADRVVKMLGFPGREYAEALEVNRYNVSQSFNIHYDWLTRKAMRDDSDFHGCQRVATALIYLTDVASGGETMFVRNPSFKGGFDKVDRRNSDHEVIQPVKGRILAWFNVHPLTEEVDKRTWHGGAPVKEGTKIAGTIYIRNCSVVQNRMRMDLVRAIREAQPVSSAIVPEKSEGAEDDEDYDYDDDDDDEDDEDEDEDVEDEDWEAFNDEDLAGMDEDEVQLVKEMKASVKAKREAEAKAEAEAKGRAEGKEREEAEEQEDDDDEEEDEDWGGEEDEEEDEDWVGDEGEGEDEENGLRDGDDQGYYDEEYYEDDEEGEFRAMGMEDMDEDWEDSGGQCGGGYEEEYDPFEVRWDEPADPDDDGEWFEMDPDKDFGGQSGFGGGEGGKRIPPMQTIIEDEADDGIEDGGDKGKDEL